ncbi:hypothetical protein AWC38_SpisGene16544 [Stylophora pistillata]|uniref:Uncharacterized protein n=1 Tax=Stylophora pistillata TaxID=50429 RepID=A0A2B4RQI2_STYPI|nr:hypothetical protein AWC38_SpisGene16544 [Stylophora pistillata]
MRFATVLLVVIVLMAMVELSETRGRGGGGRSGGSRGSRGSKSSRSRTRSRGSSSKPKITKYTPIKATSVRSPVIVKQTKLGSRSSTFKRAIAAYLVTRYVFSSASVYRQGYPMYRSYVSIRKKRAVRVTFERERLLDDWENLYLNELAGSQAMKKGIDDNLVDLKTPVKYKNGETKTLHGVDKTLSLEDIEDQDFEVVTLASYNITIVTATTCTQVEKTVKAMRSNKKQMFTGNMKTAREQE